MRQIVEQEPQRPSTRWNSLDDGTRELAARRRRIDLDEARRTLTGDLDWIVMKAIERDRERRYESVAALAADVERYLHRRPIEARPPTLGYRLSCLVRRHRTVAVATALAVLSLILGTVGATMARPALRSLQSVRWLGGRPPLTLHRTGESMATPCSGKAHGGCASCRGSPSMSQSAISKASRDWRSQFVISNCPSPRLIAAKRTR